MWLHGGAAIREWKPGLKKRFEVLQDIRFRLRLLVDTNAFIRWILGRPVPGPVERALSKQDTERLVSIVTGWEIVMNTKLGRSAKDVQTAAHEMGAKILPIRFRHLDQLSKLPTYENHRDSFDRMLIAQALAEDLTMVSGDMRFSEYKRLRVLLRRIGTPLASSTSLAA